MTKIQVTIIEKEVWSSLGLIKNIQPIKSHFTLRGQSQIIDSFQLWLIIHARRHVTDRTICVSRLKRHFDLLQFVFSGVFYASLSAKKYVRISLQRLKIQFIILIISFLYDKKKNKNERAGQQLIYTSRVHQIHNQGQLWLKRRIFLKKTFWDFKKDFGLGSYEALKPLKG